MTYENPNQFRQGIPLREGQPIQLIRYAFGRIHVVSEALGILQKIREPVTVIAIVGSYRQGKSWLANLLHGWHDRFELGAQVGECTRGIYMWDTSFIHKGKRVIMLYTEDIDESNKEIEWTTKLFVLCLVLSSTVVYNINGIIGVMLLRDFGIKIIEPYFLDTWRAAEGLKRLFKELNVYALPHSSKDLRQMQSIDTEEEFTEKTTTSVRDIFKRLEPKYIDYLKMDGLAFTDILIQCVAEMNDTDHLSIPDEYESVIQHVAHKMKEKCLTLYQADMTDLANSIPMSWEEFTAKQQAIFGNVIKDYVGSLIGSLKQINGFKEKFQQEIDNVKRPCYEKNSKELYGVNLGKATMLWNQLVEPGLNANRLFTEAEFRQAITTFEKQFAEYWMPSPEAMEALKYFKENQYKAAIDALTNFHVIDEKSAIEMKEREKLHEQFLEITQREMRLKNYLLERDQRIKAIQEALNAENEGIQQAVRRQADESQKPIKELKAKI